MQLQNLKNWSTVLKLPPDAWAAFSATAIETVPRKICSWLSNLILSLDVSKIFISSSKGSNSKTKFIRFKRERYLAGMIPKTK